MISRLNLTRKQYYSKIADLTNAGLIRRKTGRFLLTSFGKVVYEAHVLIGQAVQQIPNLKAIDSIESAEFPNSELIKVIDTLITNDNIKQVLINRERYNNLENEKPLQQTAYSSVLIEKVNEEMKKETSPPPPQLIVGIESEVEAK